LQNAARTRNEIGRARAAVASHDDNGPLRGRLLPKQIAERGNGAIDVLEMLGFAANPVEPFARP
jgi:hypothetical protein